MAVSGDVQGILRSHEFLAALRHASLNASPAEESFDRLTRLACRILHTPMGLVTLFDEGRQFCKSCLGLPEPWLSQREIPLSHSFCKYMIATGGPLIVEDTRKHPLLRTSLAVTDFGAVAYAGIPLITSEGYMLGTFCVADRIPRRWTAADVKLLEDLAASVMTELELRATRELELVARTAQARHRDAEEARRRMAILADAGAILAEVVRSEAALQLLAQRTVPYLGELSVVDLLCTAPFPAGPRVAHVDPEQADRLHGVLASSSERDTWLAGAEARPWMLSPGDTPPPGKEELVRLLQRLGVRFLMRVPILTSQGLEGLLTVGRLRQDEHPYRDVELELAQTLAGRIGVALENARLLQKEREGIRSRDEFLSIAAHELRTPLTPLKLQLETLRRSLVAAGVTDAAVTRNLERARAQVQRLGQLVERLLDVSRIATGRLGLLLEDLDLSSLATEVTDRFREEAEVAGCQLAVHTPGPVRGVWDRLRLEQVLSSLLSNAIKYGAGHPIDVSVEEHGEVARLCVQDRGIGLTREDASRIFERFERAVSPRHYGGMGLGLYVARQIVEAHGGTIVVRSQPGEGATFTAILPTHSQPRQDSEMKKAPALSPV